MTLTSFLIVARQTGVQNPLLLQPREIMCRKIISIGNNIVISSESAWSNDTQSGPTAGVNHLHRIAPSVDLVLLSHGDLAHTGLYPYAYSRWGLNAPAYSTLPVQAMARIAATEETDGIRDEEDVGGAGEQVAPGNGDDATSPDPSNSLQNSQPEEDPQPQLHSPKGKYVATPQEVHDSFDAVNTLRYSQPAHLSGKK